MRLARLMLARVSTYYQAAFRYRDAVAWSSWDDRGCFLRRDPWRLAFPDYLSVNNWTIQGLAFLCSHRVFYS